MHLKPTILNTLTACLLTLFCVHAHGQKIIPVDSTHARILRIDPSNANGGKISDFFAEVEYIPLETTNESLFGSILRLEMTDERFFVVENQSNYLLIFDRKGKFIKKIGSEAEGGMHLLDYNKWTKQLIVRTDSRKTFSYYDQDGNLLKKVPTDIFKNTDKTVADLRFFSADKAFAPHQTNKVTDTSSAYFKSFQGSLITYTYPDHKVYATGLKFPDTQIGLDNMYMGLANDLTPGNTDTTYYYSRNYANAIYSIGPNSIKLSYKFMFPAGIALPAGFANDTTLRGKRWEWFDDHRDVIQNVVNFYHMGNNLCFKAHSQAANDEDLLIYNLKSGSLIAYKHIARDESSNFLPIYEDRATYKRGGILTTYKNSLYASLSSLEMFNAYNENKEKSLTYPAHLNQYFTTRNKKDNPVIIRLKLKDDL